MNGLQDYSDLPKGEFTKILSFSYDAPMTEWDCDNDWRGMVFTLMISFDQYKVVARFPRDGYDEECVYCVGDVNAERMSQVIGSMTTPGEECNEWILPNEIVAKVREIVFCSKIPLWIGERDGDDFNPIYLFTFYDEYGTRQYRFNRNDAKGLEHLIELADLMRCGRGGLFLGQYVDTRDVLHKDGDALADDAHTAISLAVARYENDEISAGEAYDEIELWQKELQLAVGWKIISKETFDDIIDEVNDLTLDYSIFTDQSEEK